MLRGVSKGVGEIDRSDESADSGSTLAESRDVEEAGARTRCFEEIEFEREGAVEGGALRFVFGFGASM